MLKNTVVLGIGFILDGRMRMKPENVGGTYVSKLIGKVSLPRAVVILHPVSR